MCNLEEPIINFSDNVMLKVFEYNRAAIKAYSKADFKEIGRRREVKWMNGRLWETYLWISFHQNLRAGY